MKWFVIVVAALIFLLTPLSVHSEKTVPTFDVRGPTILAFFLPVTEAELSKHADTNTALDDFQFYARNVRQPLEKRGIEFQEVYEHRFFVRCGMKVYTFTPRKTGVGYYFVAPGKKPHVEYGVMTDVDLLHAADEYFHCAGKCSG
jgi:hypothetical protein